MVVAVLCALNLIFSTTYCSAKKTGAAKEVNMGIPDENKLKEALNEGKTSVNSDEAKRQFKAFLEEEERAAKILGKLEKDEKGEESEGGKLQGNQKSIKQSKLVVNSR